MVDANASEIAAPAPESPESGSARQIAGGTAIRSVGEIVAKVASVAFYIVVARKLGDDSFGSFVFGLSLATVLFSVAAFGADDLITRELSRDAALGRHLVANVIALKALTSVALLGLIAAIAAIEGYDLATGAAIVLVGLGVGVETLTKTFYAVFQAHEKMQYIAASMILQRISVAFLGVAVVLAGGALLDVTVVFAAGSFLGCASALLYLRRKIETREWELDRRRWLAVVKAGIPIGMITILYISLIKLDIALLSFLRGGDNSEVGHYGAAYRLIEATMFISGAFCAAMYPWLSRHRERNPESLMRGFGLGLKALLALLVPIALFFGLYADPIIAVLYGEQYADAVVPLQLLAGMTVLYGLNALVSLMMITRDRPGDFVRPAAVVFVQNVTFNFILIPHYGAVGAAANAIISGALLVFLTFRRVERFAGPAPHLRTWVPVVLASSAMVAAVLGTGASLNVPDVALASAAYAAVFLLVERFLFPADFAFYGAILRPLRKRLAQTEV